MQDTLHEDQYTVMNTSHSLLFRVRIFQTKVVQNSKHTFHVQQFFFFNCAIYDIMWKKVAERGKPQMTIWLMRIACWIHKATNTHTEYKILIAFPTATVVARMHASVIHYTYIACLVIIVLCILLHVSSIFRHLQGDC